MKSKTIPTVASPTLNGTLEKLIQKYPGGFKKGYYTCNYLPALSHDEVKLLLDKTSSDKGKLARLLCDVPQFQDLLNDQRNKLISNWFNNLIKANAHRESVARQLENRKIQRKKRIKTQQLRAKKYREIQVAHEAQEKAKAKRKASLWKQMQLSTEQKAILRQLAA